jgi:hypothetical protein
VYHKERDSPDNTNLSTVFKTGMLKAATEKEDECKKGREDQKDSLLTLDVARTSGRPRRFEVHDDPAAAS